MNTVVLELQ